VVDGVLVSKFSIYSSFSLRNGPLLSKILLSFLKQLYFKMTGIRIRICIQTGRYLRTGYDSFPTSEWSIGIMVAVHNGPNYSIHHKNYD